MTAPDTVDGDTSTVTLRRKIVLAAADVLEKGGLDAVSTRAVAARAGVFPPTIFRLFGDKRGLLEAVGEYGFETYLLAESRLPRSDDPVQDLRRAWDLHIGFGMRQPGFYLLVFGRSRPGHLSRAGRKAVAELQHMMTRVAAAGRLRMSVERAAAVMHAAGVGVVSTIINAPPESWDLEAVDTTRDIVFAAVTTPPAADPGHGGAGGGTAGPAMALRAALARENTSALRAAEKALLLDWLNRLADEKPVSA
ncbi:TetR family transcriptional regulator [Streptomyces sp. Ru62]|uniref:TetR/AcrR family transcriptional regulator n=1 Tax=Streptomyces sp. Ru62 TaxID=2080745 RepID=UPI000CDDD6D7|nr:TetR/AcrR family transcriptional regulator [Streptomyces sp. Ru62]POX58413.1 TetR family transcriptional regulator [Streptomyces sp. Ru62]